MPASPYPAVYTHAYVHDCERFFSYLKLRDINYSVLTALDHGMQLHADMRPFHGRWIGAACMEALQLRAYITFHHGHACMHAHAQACLQVVPVMSAFPNPDIYPAKIYVPVAIDRYELAIDPLKKIYTLNI